jgi:transcriptional regulator with XRE-family HTH domain
MQDNAGTRSNGANLMPRRPRPLDSQMGPLDAFAVELRALRDQMGPTAPSPDQISQKQGVSRSAIYAALGGTRVPSIDVLAATVASYNGDVKEWTARRTRLLDQLEARKMAAAAAANTSRPQVEGLAKPFGADLLVPIELDPDRLAPPGSAGRERLTAFRADLDQLRTSADLSYTQLERRARSLGLQLPRRSAHAMLRGETRLTWSRVEAFIRAANLAGETEIVVEIWHTRWRRLLDHLARMSVFEIPGYTPE